jgi:hypothetical protein
MASSARRAEGDWNPQPARDAQEARDLLAGPHLDNDLGDQPIKAGVGTECERAKRVAGQARLWARIARPRPRTVGIALAA